MTIDTLKPRHVNINGQRMLALPEAQFQELLRQADLWEPDMPEPDERGLYPLSVLAVIQARDILRTRRRLGLSQAELARRAGIRPETLNRIEQGRNKPSVSTIVKVDRALKEAEAKAAKNGARSMPKRQRQRRR
jgi:DNA-binding XRE family transcriptional regulator